MDVQLGVLPQDALVRLRTNQVFGRVIFRAEGLSYIGWPEQRWCRLRATEPLLELVGVEHADECIGCALAREDDLLLRLVVDEDLQALVEKALAPAHRRVIADEELVHQVLLGYLPVGDNVFAWDSRQSHVVEIDDHDPLFDLAWDKHGPL